MPPQISIEVFMRLGYALTEYYIPVVSAFLYAIDSRKTRVVVFTTSQSRQDGVSDSSQKL
jgi:hypothetical protein